MAEPDSQSQAPSTTGNFLRGFLDGAAKSGLLAGFIGVAHAAISLPAIMGGTVSLLAALNPIGLTMIGTMMLGTGMFSGIMSVRRAHEEQVTAQRISRELVREAETLASARGINQSMERDENDPVLDGGNPETALEEETSRRGGWINRTTRNLRASNRIQSIIDQGEQRATSNQDHVAQLMREREQAAHTSADPVR